MKRNFIHPAVGAGLALLLAAGCSRTIAEGPSETVSEQAISFRPRAVTRGAELSQVADGTSFGVSAWYADAAGTYANRGPAFYNTEVRRAGTLYTYDNLVYWPTSLDLCIRFFGWYPYTAVESVSATSVRPPQLVFHIDDDDVTAQIDLLYGATEPLNRESGNPVRFTFNHALTRVRFAVKLADEVPEGYSVDLHDLYLSAADHGTMTFPEAPGQLPVWNVDASGWNYYRLSDGAGLTRNLGITAGTLPRTAVPVTAEGYDLFMIPQQMHRFGMNPDTGMPYGNGIHIEYTLRNDIPEGQPGYRYIDNTVEVTLEGQEPWASGEGVLYTIVIGPRNASVVLETGDWIDGNAGNEDLSFE